MISGLVAYLFIKYAEFLKNNLFKPCDNLFLHAQIKFPSKKGCISAHQRTDRGVSLNFVPIFK